MYVQMQVEIDVEACKLKMFEFGFTLGVFICMVCKAVDSKLSSGVPTSPM
jgi:hypothetical protein